MPDLDPCAVVYDRARSDWHEALRPTQTDRSKFEQLGAAGRGAIHDPDACRLEIRSQVVHPVWCLETEFVPADLALDFGSYVVTDQYKTRLANGRQPTWDDVLSFEGGKREGDRVMLRDSQGTLLAIGRTTMDIDALQSQPKQPVIHFDRVLM